MDVEYLGIDLGRGMAMDSVAASGAYLHSPAPMPVGTVLVLDPGINQELTVRVTRVSEQVSGAERPAGMFIQPHELSSGAQERWDQWAEGKTASAASDEAASAEVTASEAHDTAPMQAEPEPAPESKPKSKSKAKAKAEDAKEQPEAKAKTKKKRSRKKKAK